VIPKIKAVRCAIYTRVSTDHGLDQEFNSLDAQYDAASAYIKSQTHAGWNLIRSRYDDGGYSGGSTDRPDLHRLLDDIRSRKLDVIVVYKVDRLTRSLADFASLSNCSTHMVCRSCRSPSNSIPRLRWAG
jgi:site-specific DNA recombinase